jgi:hypothetical protein
LACSSSSETRIRALRRLLISAPDQRRLLRAAEATISQPGGRLYAGLRALALGPEHAEHEIDELVVQGRGARSHTRGLGVASAWLEPLMMPPTRGRGWFDLVTGVGVPARAVSNRAVVGKAARRLRR